MASPATSSVLHDCRHRPPPPRRGTAALEFVIVLPVLMVIVIGAIDLSRMLHYKNVLTNASRTGAAYGATHAASDYAYDEWVARVEARSLEEAVNLPGYDGRLVDVIVTMFDDPGGAQRVQVETAYPFEMIIDWPGWPKTLTLRHSVCMRRYR
ncbi:MAG TPA: TadE family protein [Planctomycetaceae bacterium]|nr:TadE family protein [Planctomycetaceae bacterium]